MIRTPKRPKLPANTMLGNFGTARNANLGPPPTLTVARGLPFALPQHDYDRAFNAATLLSHHIGGEWTYPMLRITSPPLMEAGCVHHAPFRPNDMALCRNQITPLNQPSFSLLTGFLLTLISSRFASADLTLASNPQTTSAPVETVSLIDASGIPITTANDPADNAWVIPLTGPASAPTGAAWGAQIQYNKNLAGVLPVAFGTPTTTAKPTATATGKASSTTTTATFVSAGSPGQKTETLDLEIAFSNTFLLSQDTSLNITSTTNKTNSTTIPSLPVGLNLGLQNKWNGSVVLGGNYDSNRIYDEPHWQTTPETSAGNTSFIDTGMLDISAVILQLYTTPNATTSSEDAEYPFGGTSVQETSKSLPAMLDFNSEVLSVPDESWCARNISIVFNPDSESYPIFNIPVWDELVPKERCQVNSGKVVLGRPFFQAAYVYVNSAGDVYFSSITTDDVDVATKPFDLHVQLSEAVNGTESYGGENGTATGSGSDATGTSGAGRLGVEGLWGMVVGMGFLFIL
ncbi:uncharacterized protein BO88DRAFT_442378 [Aspergillus vadensis CBS 113365]|uniref:Acid protease n=1 Tax=Aspergillus vadensis (strain CBS 113365 / IMI 142717 / IBT 24658) TaxID=1448311 RepID=A0A319BJ38_ASPVC|nr:hypothetical protein BO88DRAFT_442378 [Aspergillus vadensis CBS 113365]PYH70920.1 hypothetical protein BO88DRAFT_442378 [Aspergillus vadensis CBS 113365]